MIAMSNDVQRLFESKHVREYLEIDKDHLHHWVNNKGLVKPVIEAGGRGGRNKFSFENLFFLALIKELLGFGVDLRTIREIIEQKITGRSRLKGGGFRKSKDINLFKFVTIYRSQIGAERRMILQIVRVSSSFKSRIVLLHKNEEHLVIGENCLVIDLTNIIEHLIKKIADPASEKEWKRAYRRYVK